ncbi:MAG: hypothetical protein QM516_07165 [Limnohabitans sp.]|nr:hypothetical protein [Limnohabitans sp.]
MRIYLDDLETSLRATSVGGALQSAASVVEQAGRMIVEVSVDGVAWNEEDLATASYAERSAGEIRLVTAHPAELLRDTCMHAADAVLNADDMQRNAATLLQSNRTKEGLDALLQSLAVWGSVQTAVSRGLALGVLSRESLAAQSVDIEGAIQALDRQLRTVRDAMSNGDQTALADTLLYEFPQVAKQFATMLVSLANECARVLTSGANTTRAV